MAVFFYKVRDKEGRTLQGSLDAADGKELRKKLLEREYFIIDYSEKKAQGSFLRVAIFPRFSRVGLMDIAVFSWQLCTLLQAGLTLMSSLRILIGQIKNEKLKTVLAAVCQRVEEGTSFTDALKEHPDVFSRLYVQMVNAGEVSGVLGEMITRLAVYYERQAEIRSKIIPALIYPAILLVVSLTVIVFLVVVVLPQFAAIFHEIGVAIPLPTQGLLFVGSMVKKFWIVVVLFLFWLGILVKTFLRSEAGKWFFHSLQLRIPLVGTLIRKAVAVQFTQTLATLVSSGIPILTSLDVVTDTIDNKVVITALKKVAASVEQGKPMTQPLQESGLFPDMVVNMIRVGEETGSLESMLNKVADFYYKDINAAIDAFTKMVEPILMVSMAMVIGYIALSIFLPMANLLQNVR